MVDQDPNGSETGSRLVRDRSRRDPSGIGKELSDRAQDRAQDLIWIESGSLLKGSWQDWNRIRTNKSAIWMGAGGVEPELSWDQDEGQNQDGTGTGLGWDSGRTGKRSGWALTGR